MPKLLGSRTISFENLVMAVESNNEKYVPSQNIASLRKKVSENEDGEALLELYIQKKDPTIYIFARSSKEIQELPRYITREIIASFVFMLIHRAYYKSAYFFPAERTGMMQFLPTIQICTDKEAIPKEMVSNKNENEPIFSMPVNDLIHTISVACDSKNQSRRQQLAEKDPKIRRYIELSEILENDILYGGIETIEKPDESVEILFKLKGDVNVFDIPPVSSGIKDLIPLVLYLRYVAEERDLVIIDEPEMNLHPEAQIKIMEFLAMMTNSGLNIITTTHSPYLVDHISNLTKAYELKKCGKEKLEDKFKLKNDLCFIDSDKVAVYLFDNNTAKDIFKEDDLVDWDTFGNVSDYVSNLYFDL
jgi:predicted ATP-binding protein involved in virulence